MASPRIPTRVGDLFVETVGEGPPAVLWHSLFVDSRTWGRVLGPLAERRTLIVIDGPGHGRSTPPPRLFTLDECAQAAAEILAALGVTGPVDWVGNAWGGHVGILFATAPRRCRSLVTLGTPIQPVASRERPKLAVMVNLFRWLGPIAPLRGAVVQALLAEQVRTGDAEAVRLVTSALSEANRRGMYRAMRSAMLNRPDLSSRLTAVEAPTLFVTGEHDPLWRLPAARAAVASMARAHAAEIAGVSHLPPLEAPDQTVRLITEHWSAHGPLEV